MFCYWLCGFELIKATIKHTYFYCVPMSQIFRPERAIIGPCIETKEVKC